MLVGNIIFDKLNNSMVDGREREDGDIITMKFLADAN